MGLLARSLASKARAEHPAMSLVLPAPARSDNIRGILAMLASMAVFVVNDTLMKIAAGHLPTGEAIFLRGLFTTVLGLALIAASGAAPKLPHALSPTVLWRAAADLGGTITFLSALVHMPMADIFGILQFVPLAVTAGAALFLGAPVGWRRWTATSIGLLGVLIIVRPGGNAFTPFAVLAIVSVLFSAARDLLSRSVPPGIPPLIIVTTSAAVVTLASLGFSLAETWTQPTSATLAILIIASMALLAGQYWLVAAMRTGDIAVVAPFRYSIMLWAILAGYLVWHERPDLPSWIGIAIVTAAGIYTFLREQRLARARPS
jgi:drug/metabolite transporter (DMT)-like permease